MFVESHGALDGSQTHNHHFHDGRGLVVLHAPHHVHDAGQRGFVVPEVFAQVPLAHGEVHVKCVFHLTQRDIPRIGLIFADGVQHGFAYGNLLGYTQHGHDRLGFRREPTRGAQIERSQRPHIAAVLKLTVHREQKSRRTHPRLHPYHLIII